mmetsp:Transcript_1456/g.1595  ORF Transcript_1456/g.1595 Transcript_1456/m.1595 type:complete len:1112 (+) Transcript_1456:180-3515(+)
MESFDLVSQLQTLLLPNKEDSTSEKKVESISGKTSSTKTNSNNDSNIRNGSPSRDLTYDIGKDSSVILNHSGEIRINSSLILNRSEEVLEFWFSGDLTVNYKTKWFPDGSAETQRRADETVLKLFGDLFSLAVNDQLNEWTREIRSSVGLILLLDQFSRHIYRLQNVSSDDPRRAIVDAKALKVAEGLTAVEGWDIGLSIHEFVFSLMPYRHTPTVERLTEVIVLISKREKTETEAMDLLHKFRKTTLRRLQHLQDIQRADETDDILERTGFSSDESDMPLNILVKSTEQFLRKYMNQENIKQNKGTQENKDYEPLCISLSGGVDSMVIAKILVHLKSTGRVPIGAIIAVHIDYANRAESGKEAAFVRSWCESLGIICRIRVVNEVTRGITGREEFEKISRDIRYDFYKSIMGSTGCRGVLFGHHLGDVQENVISNVMRGCSPLSLSGMGESGISNGVHVWRPLLAHPKEDIFVFAHRYGVPYFKDSTPSWSTRGKLRTLLLPLLTDMYGLGCVSSLTSLAVESDEVSSLVKKNIYSPFLNTVERFPCGLRVNILPFINEPLCFWREMLKELMHSMGMSMVRERSVKSFLERIQARKIVGWIELRKGFHTMLCDDGQLLILKDGVLSTGTVPPAIKEPTGAVIVTEMNSSKKDLSSPPQGALSGVGNRRNDLVCPPLTISSTSSTARSSISTASMTTEISSVNTEMNVPDSKVEVEGKEGDIDVKLAYVVVDGKLAIFQDGLSQSKGGDEVYVVDDGKLTVVDELPPSQGVDLGAKPYVVVNGKLATFEELSVKDKVVNVSDKLVYVVDDGKLAVVDKVAPPPANMENSVHGDSKLLDAGDTISASRDALPIKYFNSIVNSKWITGIRFPIKILESSAHIDEVYIQSLNIGFWEVKVCVVDSSTYGVISLSGDTINDYSKNKNNSSDNDLNINNKKKYNNKCSNKILQSVADVLIGSFSYHMSVPDNIFELGILGDNSAAGGFKNHKKQVKEFRMKKNGRSELNNDTSGSTYVRADSSSSSIDNNNSYKTNDLYDTKNPKIDMNSEKVNIETKIKKIEELIVDVPALSGVDNRVKMGIPFLIPIIKNNCLENDIEDDLINVIIRLDYTYLG